ncbi:hypothetical protein AB1Y20_008157 [Prymnesium parvum]|uniref:Pentraxin (PTX) domain-containing protein n=1 Tax=Prymnesium parvum TaxID=97485 RepID=A0AB34ITE9_PRYPA
MWPCLASLLSTGRAGTCSAGGAGYAYVFDALRSTTISLQWQTRPLSAITIEYWVNVLDPHITELPVFAYSAYSSTGRYGEGGAPYENANELVLMHKNGYLRLWRATQRGPDFPIPNDVYARAGSWVHIALAWSADPSASPHGQIALYVDGAFLANSTVCALGECDMGKPLQPGGVIHLGNDADRPWGDFDEFQALTGGVDELRVWESIRTDEQIRASYRLATVADEDLSFYWRFDSPPPESGVALDHSGKGRDGLVGRLPTLENLMVYVTQKPPQIPVAPTKLPSAAPVVGDAPVVTVIVNGSNEISLSSFDPEDDDLATTIVTMPSHGALFDANGTALLAGMTVNDGARRQSKRVWYHTAEFSNWTGDSFTYAVSDGGEPVTGTVVLERYHIQPPPDRQLVAPEDELSFIVLGQPYITSQSKRLANLRVRILSLPSRGTLYHACFQNSIEQYSSMCTSAEEAQPVTAGSLLNNSRGIVMFRGDLNTFDAELYASFRYQLVDPEDDTLVSQEASVRISVTPVNDSPHGTSLFNISVSGPTLIPLDGRDDDNTNESDAQSQKFATISKFPLIGQLLLVNATGPGAPVPKSTLPTLTTNVWAAEVVRFSSQFSKCVGCTMWSGASRTSCNQASVQSTSTCHGAACEVAFGDDLTWGDGTCTDPAWTAAEILGPPDFYPSYGDSPLGWDLSHENNGLEFIELRIPASLYITGIEVFETYKPGSIYRVSTTRAYVDDNTVACCGVDIQLEGECESIPICSSNTTWDELWSGEASSAGESSRIFNPPVCPYTYKSDVIRLDLDTKAVPGWNNFDAVRVSGTSDLSKGNVIPDARGKNKVYYIPLQGTHGGDSFEFQLTDWGDPRSSRAPRVRWGVVSSHRRSQGASSARARCRPAPAFRAAPDAAY